MRFELGKAGAWNGIKFVDAQNGKAFIGQRVDDESKQADGSLRDEIQIDCFYDRETGGSVAVPTHLNREQVAALLPYLRHFMETGVLAEPLPPDMDVITRECLIDLVGDLQARIELERRTAGVNRATIVRLKAKVQELSDESGRLTDEELEAMNQITAEHDRLRPLAIRQENKIATLEREAHLMKKLLGEVRDYCRPDFAGSESTAVMRQRFIEKIDSIMPADPA